MKCNGFSVRPKQGFVARSVRARPEIKHGLRRRFSENIQPDPRPITSPAPRHSPQKRVTHEPLLIN